MFNPPRSFVHGNTHDTVGPAAPAAGSPHPTHFVLLAVAFPPLYPVLPVKPGGYFGTQQRHKDPSELKNRNDLSPLGKVFTISTWIQSSL